MPAARRATAATGRRKTLPTTFPGFGRSSARPHTVLAVFRSGILPGPSTSGSDCRLSRGGTADSLVATECKRCHVGLLDSQPGCDFGVVMALEPHLQNDLLLRGSKAEQIQAFEMVFNSMPIVATSNLGREFLLTSGTVPQGSFHIADGFPASGRRSGSQHRDSGILTKFRAANGGPDFGCCIGLDGTRQRRRQRLNLLGQIVSGSKIPLLKVGLVSTVRKALKLSNRCARPGA